MNKNINKSGLQQIEQDLNQMIIKLLLKLNNEENENDNKEDLIKQINALSKSVPQLIKLSERISSENNHKIEIDKKYFNIMKDDNILEKAIEVINFVNNYE